MKKPRDLKFIQFLALATLAAGSTAYAQPRANPASATAKPSALVVKNNESILFLGDSITFWGNVQAGGFGQLAVSGLQANGVTVTSSNAGIRGDTSNGMLGRLPDLLSRKPTFMTLSCGINDVLTGCPLDGYKSNITAIVDQAQAAGVKVMLLTATMIGEDANNEKNQQLAPFNDFVRRLAKEKQCLLADVSPDLLAAIKPAHGGKPQAPGQITWDGVHLNPFGNQLMAIRVLKAFGMNDSQLKTAEEYWLDIPEYSACTVASTGLGVTMRQYQLMYDLAAADNCTVDEWIRTQLLKRLPSPASAVSVATGVEAHSKKKASAVVPIEKSSAAGFAIKNSESIAFVGDAITLEGNRTASGFVRLVTSGLKGNGLTITPFAAGVRDDTSQRMRDRLASDALSHKPTFLVLSPGTTDVRAGLSLDQFKTNVTSIVDQAQAAGVQVMILTTQMMTDERAESDNNVRLAPFNAFLRQLATEKKCLLADVNAEMHDAIQPGKDGKPQRPGQIFWNDGDIIPFGHQLVATCVLKAFGANANQVKTAREYWLALPDSDACSVIAGGMVLTLRQYHDMRDLANQADCTVDEWCRRQVNELVPPADSARK